MIEVFTPSFADESNTNAQNLTVKEVVARLDPARFRVTMLCENAADPRIAARPNTRFLAWHAHGNAAWALLRCLTSPPDVYFFPREGPLDAAFLRCRRWFGLRSAVVTYVVSGGLEPGPIRAPLLRAIRAADILVANNACLAEVIHRQTGLSASIIFDGIDRRYFFPPVRSPALPPALTKDRAQPLTVLYAGSFRPYKRVDLVVREAARWPQVNFRIAGSGEEQAACVQLAAQLGCANTRFLGHLGLKDLGEEMRSADIFLFPSNIEGQPQVLGQAAACGLPAVAMENYHPDYVENGVTGFLVASDEELSTKLGLLLTDQQLRARMSAAAISKSLLLEWDDIARQWEATFEAAIAHRKGLKLNSSAAASRP